MHSADALATSPKAAGSFDRCIPLAQTVALIPQLRARYGITRIAEITHLDRVGIPVMSAIVPDSTDRISVYNGKGPTRESALVGAVMEAVERQQAVKPPIVPLRADVRSTSLIGPNELGAHRLWRGPVLDVAPAFDLIAEEPIQVPFAAVRCRPSGDHVLRFWSTNGLASGNTLAEAVYHAVCELIERHLWSVAHARAHVRPLAIVSQFIGGEVSLPTFIDDPVAWDVPLPTGRAMIDDLVSHVVDAGLTLSLRCVEMDSFPYLFTATIAEEATSPSVAHFGAGCSWSPEHAAIRAITEAAQSRATDCQAAREDILRPNDPRPLHGDRHRRKTGVPAGRWYYDAPTLTRTLGSFEDFACDDVANDVRRIIALFRDAQLGRLAIVDLSPPDLPVHVVRAIAPGLETAMLDERIGPTISAILDLNRTLPLLPIECATSKRKMVV